MSFSKMDLKWLRGKKVKLLEPLCDFNVEEKR